MRLPPTRCFTRALALAAGGLALLAAPARAQNETLIEVLAPILAASDARKWDEAALRRGLAFPDSTVREQAALAAGRLGDPGAVPLLVPTLDDSVAIVRSAGAFSLGLVGDTAAVAPIIRRLTTPPMLDGESAAEMAAALARIGGQPAADFFASVLTGREKLQVADPSPVIARMVGDAWRLGRRAPVNALLPFLTDSLEDLRWRSVYTLGRIRSAAPALGDRMPAALLDRSASVKAAAARNLTKTFADSARVGAGTLADLLSRALDNTDPQVRINALRSLGTFGRPTDAARVSLLANDPMPTVAVEAIATLGELGGPDAAAALTRFADEKKSFAMRREALTALARIDTAAFRASAAPWAASKDWRERAVVAEASAQYLGEPGATPFLKDADGRVLAATLQGWLAGTEGAPAPLLAAARGATAHRDAMVRAQAAAALGRALDPADVPALAGIVGASKGDSFPDATINALEALAGIAKATPAGKARVEGEFLRTSRRPDDYVVRRWAEENWPEAAARWGPAWPIATGRSALDYRELVRRFLLPTSPERATHVFLEVDQKGTVELELFGYEAPITVANFLALVDRHYFDRLRFHRVVPNFVVQDGDPRGDGNGSPGTTIRDEPNRRRYEGMMMGMALSGPDTGGSQWFVNVSPQPHLDGTYTIFGKVVAGHGTLLRVLQGDQIRTIRR
ncbi:MAG TPA: peptidylprolyl isomerase [Gemmatimonadales bacterium]|nr:peptidylprolyl isomerase [Gemmatimonadales bacterium]